MVPVSKLRAIAVTTLKMMASMDSESMMELNARNSLSPRPVEQLVQLSISKGASRCALGSMIFMST